MELEILSFIIASAVLAFTPGPDNIFVLMTSLTDGFSSALKFIAGLITGVVIHTGLIALGVSELIKNSDYGLIVLKVFAAGYLSWLAYLTFRHRKDPLELKQKKSKNFNYYTRGLVMNLTNPKVLLFFLALFPAFANLNHPGFELRLLILGFLFALVTLVVFGFIAWMADKGIKQRIQNPAILLSLNWMTVVIFLSMAVLISFQ